ncbi:uncharacterized protein F5891DRAFT_982477 [Suillus fuscotomentosus]|uniref:Uncharacterized protein n=1 Tax=Suillus fuscotomentosus TaxID=1912939 RepID=A0AAD4E115_9AGAM|nr:uncharacterized protein F5891DRAFT_982477 [Suillus fuscotomentosus]KAG1897759.1 hypothetical protein F5891DRAFT_982477 [Suillus fuscotomentosus]
MSTIRKQDMADSLSEILTSASVTYGESRSVPSITQSKQKCYCNQSYACQIDSRGDKLFVTTNHDLRLKIMWRECDSESWAAVRLKGCLWHLAWRNRKETGRLIYHRHMVDILEIIATKRHIQVELNEQFGQPNRLSRSRIWIESRAAKRVFGGNKAIAIPIAILNHRKSEKQRALEYPESKIIQRSITADLNQSLKRLIIFNAIANGESHIPMNYDAEQIKGSLGSPLRMFQGTEAQHVSGWNTMYVFG